MLSPDSRANLARCQAEAPLIALCRFPKPALKHCKKNDTDGCIHCKFKDMKREMKESKSIMIRCPYCGFQSNPSGVFQHINEVHGGKQRITNMVKRAMMDRFSKKRHKGMVFPIDTTRSGVFPEPANEELSPSEELRFMMERLLDERRALLPMVMAGIRSSYKAKRLKSKKKFWKRYYEDLEEV
jgi:hypothetical protein